MVVGTIYSPNWQYIPLRYHLHIANWRTIYHLLPIKGTRKLHWHMAQIVEQILPELIVWTKWPKTLVSAIPPVDTSWPETESYKSVTCKRIAQMKKLGQQVLNCYISTFHQLEILSNASHDCLRKSATSWCFCLFKAIFFTFYHSKSPLNHQLGNIFFQAPKRQIWGCFDPFWMSQPWQGIGSWIDEAIAGCVYHHRN